MLKYFISIGVICFFVMAVVIYAFNSIGGPIKTRQKKLDETRIQNIQSIKASVENYYFSTGKLPDTLIAINNSQTNLQELKDPESGKPYEYKAAGDNAYQVCANFESDSNSQSADNKYSNELFKHPKGYYCLNFNIQKSSISAVPYSYSNFISSTAYSYEPYNKSKVAQSFKVEESKDVKGIKTKLIFKNSYLTRKKEVSKIFVREMVNKVNPEEGKVVASGEFLPKIDEEYETDILFQNAVKLDANKDYVIIFEVGGNDTMNLFYSNDNPDPNGSLFVFNSSNIPSSDPDIFIWKQYEDRDVFYSLISN